MSRSSRQERRVRAERAADAAVAGILSAAISNIQEERVYTRVSRTKPLTFLGIPAQVKTWYRHTNPLGRRVVATWWEIDNPNTGHSAGDLVLRDIVGDGRTSDFTVLDSVVIPGGTERDAARYAEQRLGA